MLPQASLLLVTALNVVTSLLLNETFEQGHNALISTGFWDVVGSVVDGNCGGGANTTKLALCLFGGSSLTTRRSVILRGGELLRFYLRAGNFDNFERQYQTGCGGITESGQEVILEYTRDEGLSHHELRCPLSRAAALAFVSHAGSMPARSSPLHNILNQTPASL